MATPHAGAMGFGNVRSAAVLGQPLDLVIPLRLDDGESIEAGCVGAEVHSGERRVPPSRVRAVLETGADGSHQIRITTASPIDEPIVTATVFAGCPAQMTRRFVAFADPPQVQSPATVAQLPAAPAPTALAPAPAPAPAPNPAPAPAPAPAAQVSDKPPVKNVARAGRAAPTPQAAATSEARPKRPRRVAQAPATSAPRPRLQLDPVEPPLNRDDETQARIATAVAAATAAEAAASAAAERVRALDAELAAMRRESQAREALMLQMRAELAQRDLAQNLLPWLIGLIVALAAGLGWMWLRMRQIAAERAREPWYTESPLSSAPDSAIDTEAGMRAASPPPAATTVTSAPAAWSFDAPVAASGAPRSAPAPLIDTAPAGLQVEVIEPAPRRAVTVEEQIDLEQQADFFIVLGQDDAAVDLLLTHLRGTGGTSPMPYLKLLEIYRRTGDRDAYERTRIRFNQRFNGVAPEWDADASGRTLDEYPEVMRRIQSVWWSPLDAMADLEALLFRRGGDAELFDLPAYQEVMFLYQLARDRHLNEPGSGDAPASQVDVLLPLSDSVFDSGMSVHHFDIEATQVLHPRPHASEPESPATAPAPTAAKPLRELDIDLDLGIDLRFDPPDAEREKKGR